MAAWTGQPTEGTTKNGATKHSPYPVAYMSDKLRDNTQTKPMFWLPDLVLLVKKNNKK
jgi:hypothetical protein